MWIYTSEGKDWILLNTEAIQKIVASSDGAARPKWSVRVEHLGGGHDTVLGTFASDDEAHRFLNLLISQIGKKAQVIDFAQAVKNVAEG